MFVSAVNLFFFYSSVFSVPVFVYCKFDVPCQLDEVTDYNSVTNRLMIVCMDIFFQRRILAP